MGAGDAWRLYVPLFEMCKFGSQTYQFYPFQLKKTYRFPNYNKAFEAFSSNWAQLGCFTFHIKLSHGPKCSGGNEDTLWYDAYIALTFSQYLHFMLLIWGNDTLQGVDRWCSWPENKRTRLERELLYLLQLAQSMLGMKMRKINNNSHASIQTSMKVDMKIWTKVTW